MLEFCPGPGLLQGKLLIEPVFDPDAAAVIIIIIERPGIDAHVAQPDHGHGVNVVVAREAPEDLVQVRGRFPKAYLALAEYAPVIREAYGAHGAHPVTQLFFGVIGPGGSSQHPAQADGEDDRR